MTNVNVLSYRLALTIEFYGITMASDILGGDMYRNFVLSSVIEMAAHLLFIICVR